MNGCWVSGRHGGINPMVRHYYSISISIVAEPRCNASPLGCWATTFRAGETICRRGAAAGPQPAGGRRIVIIGALLQGPMTQRALAGHVLVRTAGAWSPQLKKSRCWRQEESSGLSCWLVVGLAPMSGATTGGRPAHAPGPRGSLFPHPKGCSWRDDAIADECGDTLWRLPD